MTKNSFTKHSGDDTRRFRFGPVQQVLSVKNKSRTHDYMDVRQTNVSNQREEIVDESTLSPSSLTHLTTHHIPDVRAGQARG